MKTKKYLLSTIFVGIMILFSGMFYAYGYGGAGGNTCSNNDCNECTNGSPGPYPECPITEDRCLNGSAGPYPACPVPDPRCNNGSAGPYPACPIPDPQCMNGSFGPYPSCPLPDPRCPNGASNYPLCTFTVVTLCTNGATNFPLCTNTVVTQGCTNGFTNPPVCGDVCGDGVCSAIEGLTSFCTIDCKKDCLTPGTCGPNKCTNSYTNYPICGPDILVGKTQCQSTQSGTAPTCSNSGIYKALSQSTQKIGNITKTTFYGSCTNATSTDTDTNRCTYTETIVTDTCPAVPVPAPGWCANGTILSGGKDSQGCDLPSTCKEGNTCLVLTPIITQTTTQTNTNTNSTSPVCPSGYTYGVPGNGVGSAIGNCFQEISRDTLNSLDRSVTIWWSNNQYGVGGSQYYGRTANEYDKEDPIPYIMVEPTYVENTPVNQTTIQTTNTGCIGGTIVPGPNNTSLCQKTASCETVCPAISTPPADWCSDGTIVAGGKDAQGCNLPDRCEKTGCPTLDPLPANFCYGGTLIPGVLDARACPTRPTCSIEIICPAIVASYTDACIGGTLIPGGKDTRGCSLPDKCQKTGCPTLDPLPANFCYGGTIIPGVLDARACPTLPTCSIEKKYYLISGTVTNDIGGAIPNIQVNLKNATGKITSATTNDAGRYTFSGNIPGIYTIRPENTQPYIFPYSEEVEVTTSDVNLDFSGINLDTVDNDDTAELLKQSAESDELIFKGLQEESTGISDWIKSILKGSPNVQNRNNAGQTGTLSQGTTGNSFANIFETNSLFKLLSEGYLPLTNSYSPIPLSLLEKFGDTSTICGNGTVESGETCDDGINNGTEGLCSSDCLYIGEVRYTGEETSGLESNAISDGLEVSLEAYQEVGDMVSGVVDTGINFVEDATGVISEVFKNIVSEPFQSAAEFLKETFIENTSPEVRAIIAQTAEVAQEVGKYTVIGATSLLGVTAVSLNVLVFKSMWTTYTVLEGDTLSSIGSQFTMTERAMRTKNGLGKGKRLRPGMKIRVRNRHFIEKDYLDQLKSVLKDELTKRNHGKMADKIDKLFAKK